MMGTATEHQEPTASQEPRTARAEKMPEVEKIAKLKKCKKILKSSWQKKNNLLNSLTMGERKAMTSSNGVSVELCTR